jgi:hypothetical protein
LLPQPFAVVFHDGGDEFAYTSPAAAEPATESRA